MKILITILLFLLSVLSITANQSESEEKWHLTHYDDHSGMSHWHVTRILQDSRGFMWFASWNGLNRYDGYEFVVFKSMPTDESLLTSDRIRNIILGKDGNIYCNINEQVWRFNLSTYKFEKTDAATQGYYISILKSDSLIKAPFDINIGGHDIKKARQVFNDNQGNKWVASEYGIQKILQKSRPATPLTSVPTDVIRCIYRDNQNRIWITGRNQRVVTVLDSMANVIGYLGKDGRLHSKPIECLPVYSIYQQKNGTIWLGTKPGGLYSLDETKPGVFNMHNYHKGTTNQIRNGFTLNVDAVYDFAEDSRGRLWIATHGGGLNLMEFTGNPAAERKAGKPYSVRFTNKENQFRSFPVECFNMRRLLILGDTLLLATSTDGLLTCKINQDKDFKFKRHLRQPGRHESLSGNSLMSILKDSKGRLFFSTESGGINLLTSKNINADELSFKHFNTPMGMGSDVALSMTEVNDELLVQCSNQISIIDADKDNIENFNAMFFSENHHFSDADPLELPDGRVLLALERGVIVVPKEKFYEQSHAPRIAIVSYSISGQATNYSADNCDTITLASNERNISIQYAALDFTNNSHIKYISRLTPEKSWWNSGDSATWTPAHDSRRISLYDLLPGTYRLDIRSTNAQGVWSDYTRTIYIKVEPTFWETPIALIIYILLFIGFVSGVTYLSLYIKNLKKQREETLQEYLKQIEMNKKQTPTTEATSITGTVRNSLRESYLNEAIQQINNVTDTTNPLLNITEEENKILNEAENYQQANALEQRTNAETKALALPHITKEDNTFLRKLQEYIEQNIGNSDTSVEDIASATAMSRSSLNRKTKSLLGITPADLLKEARLKHACHLLITTSDSINDISSACGFSDPKYFSKCFKASYEMSPSEYRTKA